jgi:hypothetical protein
MLLSARLLSVCACRSTSLQRQGSGTLDQGKATVLVQGQLSEVAAANFSGTRVPLVDVLFTLAADAPAGLHDLLRIGSVDDPVYISSLTSSGDDISVNQEAAQVRFRRPTAECQTSRCTLFSGIMVQGPAFPAHEAACFGVVLKKWGLCR